MKNILPAIFFIISEASVIFTLFVVTLVTDYPMKWESVGNTETKSDTVSGWTATSNTANNYSDSYFLETFNYYKFCFGNKDRIQVILPFVIR